MAKVNRFFLLLPMLLCGGFSVLRANAAQSDSPPNIVLIVADDLSWNDLACYGNPLHRTPHLDRLATEGMRFQEAYAASPICSASRASLLTGRSPARLGFEFVIKDAPVEPPEGTTLRPPPNAQNLPLSEVTLGEALGEVGYATGFFGKWHVSQHHEEYLGWSPTHGPLQQGYAEGDMEFGIHPYGDYARPPKERGPLPEGDYGEDELTNRAVDFLRRHCDEAFFLHLSHYYVHDPVRSRAQWLVDQYADRLADGTPPIRATYAAMVETLDHRVGELMQALEELGLAENTLVVFTSDNGGNPNYAANGPLRGGKWSLYEGGIRVPWIVSWPGQVPAGTSSDEPIIAADLMLTLCAATGAALPNVELDGQNLLPLWRGESTAEPVNRALVWHFPYYHPVTGFHDALPQIGIDDFAVSQMRPASAIRLGEWTLLHPYESGDDELYRLTADLSQQRDLAVEHPDRARELRSLLGESLDAVGARLPTPISESEADVASRSDAVPGQTRAYDPPVEAFAGRNFTAEELELNPAGKVRIADGELSLDSPPEGFTHREDLGILLYDSAKVQRIHAWPRPYAFCEAPRMAVAANGEWILGFAAGKGHQFGEQEKANDIFLSRSSDAGQTWSAPALAWGILPYNQHAFNPLRPIDEQRIFTFQQESTLQHTRQSPHSGPICFRTSDDHGQTWSELERIRPVNDPDYIGVCHMPSGVTCSGHWLLGTYRVEIVDDGAGGLKRVDRQYVLRSTDQGETWTLVPGPHPEGWQIPGTERMLEGLIRPLSSGEVVMFIRNATGVIWEQRSRDEGATWSDLQPTSLAHPDAPPMIYSLGSGRGFVALTHNRGASDADWNMGYDDRRELWVSRSDPEARNWSEPRLLLADACSPAFGPEGWVEVSYASAYSHKGKLHVFLDHQKRQILHLSISIEDLDRLPLRQDLN